MENAKGVASESAKEERGGAATRGGRDSERAGEDADEQTVKAWPTLLVFQSTIVVVWVGIGLESTKTVSTGGTTNRVNCLSEKSRDDNRC